MVDIAESSISVVFGWDCQGDMELPFDEIVSIIDLAKKSGAERIGLLTGAIL